MPKYKYLFTYGGPNAAKVAARKKISLGGDAKVLTVEEAIAANIDPPKDAPRPDVQVTHVVVAGEQKEAPSQLLPPPVA